MNFGYRTATPDLVFLRGQSLATPTGQENDERVICPHLEQSLCRKIYSRGKLLGCENEGAAGTMKVLSSRVNHILLENEDRKASMSSSL